MRSLQSHKSSTISQLGILVHHNTDESNLLQAITAINGVSHITQNVFQAPSDLHTSTEIIQDAPRYVVHPKAGTDTAMTEDLLKAWALGGSMIERCEDDGKILSWAGCLLSPEGKNAVEKYDGVETLSIEENKRGHLKNSSDSTVLANEFPRYEAWAKAGTDTKQTGEFLKAQMEVGSRFVPCKDGEEVVAWCGFRLGPEAKEVVEGYEGVELLMASDGSQKHYNFEGSLDVEEDKTLAACGLPRYEALPKKGTDTEKTEDFLKTEVEEGS
jgi:hypothetical protein